MRDVLVICDASPIIALEAIGQIDLLHKLFSDIWITDVVREEIKAELPPWIQTTTAYDQQHYKDFLQLVDRGEASAIALAVRHPTATLVIDERKGRQLARSLSISITGLVGILLLAAEARLLPKDQGVVSDLEAHGFWLSDHLKRLLADRL